ncbi:MULTISPECIES: crossover junction endodeoxyribonuclease RuvC [Legionella]|uniref:Crossover junction endodeoxyribonuclease RuvC n=1 Tax=Legionella septentrionalis TaxID=2498109 RepID=A0A3S0X377_9GAMM|nr:MULTISPECIES: crossover junction endodeoxyribonuclease RuvC [Legionella]MCP0913639.1 crossover junction endodeoxyribonuclease RuvC [Legionella sp. 27cVA30]RUQ81646.1 crossover junction endodeoxyribonuclease RuvC [Legionella septentrionalis]RUQ96333.1 crossover junction endodeoxyribonuclease RuvC [Legionella septentrionalis]RUR09094.1 crossover junction endodeoxyribonuclease RuvC [Legionella septentrionalis]RUR14155.1 crossover junction endodeoxyribonuclease RuvC [Legionella septentrionalis]
MTIILGIDPGSRVTGYGIIKEQGKQLHYLDSGCIRTPQGELSEKLLSIFNGICHLMENFNPDEVAIEQVFLHQNADAALKLGHARGVAMVACASHRIKVNEYSARAVKQSLVGYGAAQKEQVKHMVVNLLKLNRPPQSDAADALAIAICHSHMRHGLLNMNIVTARGRRRR